MNILILCNHSFKTYPYHKVLDYKKDNLFLMMTSEMIEAERDFIEENRSKYKCLNIYDNFSSNGKVEYDAIEIDKDYPIDVVVTISETEIERASKLREYFKIDGQSYESALAFRDKITMKSLVKKNGLMVPKFNKVDSAVDLIEFIQKNGYPVFVKPKSSAGSLGAMKLANDEELKEFLSTTYINLNDPFAGYDKKYEVEEYINEDFYSINGVVMDNEVVLVHAASYNTHADLEHISKYGYWSSEVLNKKNELYDIMVNYIQKLVNSLPSTGNFVFHSEVFIDKEKNIILCEIACRPPGGGMMQAINNTFDIDLFKLAVLLQVDPNLVDKEELITKNNNYDKLYASVFVHPNKGTLKHINKKCDLDFVISYEYFVEVGKKYNETGGDSCEGAAIFIVSDDTEEELRKSVENSVKWFRNNTTWENI